MEEKDEKLNYWLDSPTPAMLETARTELKETPENKEQALDEFRTLIKQEKNLVIPMTDEYLVRFLRARKYDVKNTFKLMQNHWHFREKHKALFDSIDTNRIIEVMLRSFFGALLYRDRQGCTIFVFKIAKWDPDLDDVDTIFQLICLNMLFTIREQATQICGYRIILDLRKWSWKHMKRATPSNLLLLTSSTQFCYPARYKAVHIITRTKLFTKFWPIVKPLLTAKLQRRIHLHDSDLTSLQQYIHPDVLPIELGGNGPPMDNIVWKESMDRDAPSLIELLSYGYKNN